MKIIILLVPFVILMAVCGISNAGNLEEKYIGSYSFPGDRNEFPFYIHITMKENNITGYAVDGNCQRARIKGKYLDSSYTMNMHPDKHGDSTDQDVTYKGNKKGDRITGEWVHSVGLTGNWSAKRTELTLEQVEKQLKMPCLEQ